MSGRPQKYTAAERRDAIGLSREVGPAEASRRLGIPVGTLTCWGHKARTAEAEGGCWPPMPAPATEDEDAAATPVAEEQSDTSSDAEGGRRARRVARVYTPSQRAEALELASRVGVTEAARRLTISRFSVYEWRRKVALAARGEGDSPTSGPDPADVEARRDREILDMWREHPGLGPSQVKNQLRRKGIRVSTGTVRRVMEDAGYRPPKRRAGKAHERRYEAIRPNHLWHLDFVHRWIGRASTFTLILIDDFARFVVGHGVDDAERADLVLKTFEEAVARHGKPEMVVHDKGSAFWSWKGISRFTALLEEMDVEQIPATKETNGKLENFNANLHKELWDVQRFHDVNAMKRRLATHLHWFNHRRTHHALGGLLVPADRFYGRVDEVMARIEAGAAADDGDPHALRDRTLDLFRVLSTGGRPEVWLMGNRIL